MSVTPRLRGRAAVTQRDRRLDLFPLCAHCLLEGITKATDEIDHIKRLKDGGADTDDNCQGLCFRHHKIKTGREAGHKQGYDITGKPLDAGHPWSVG